MGFKEAFEHYATKYEEMYKTRPLKNAKTMSQMKKIVESLPADELWAVIDAFLNCREAWVVKRAHDIGILLADLQKYRVMARNGLQVIDAKKIEKKATEEDEWARILRRIEEKKRGGDL